MNPPRAAGQPERASLAWSRTAIALAVNAVLILRSGVVAHDFTLLAVSLALGLLSAALLVIPRQRQRELESGRPPPPSRALLLLTSAGTVLAAAAGLVVVLH